jgi:hypothetical protein
LQLNAAAGFRARIERATRMPRRTIGCIAAVAAGLVLIVLALVVIWLAP